MPPRAPRAPRTQLPQPLRHKLILNRWLLGLFNAQKFEDLAAILQDAPEGLDENNVSRFHGALTARLFNLTQLPEVVGCQWTRS